MSQESSPPPAPPTPNVLRCVPPPLVHANVPGDPDALRREATDHLARWPALQVMADVLMTLRAAGVSWWTPAHLGARWPVPERLRWLEQRADLREAIARSLTGVPLRPGHGGSVAFQAELVEACLDVSAEAARVEEAFDPRDVVVYGPVAEIWDELVARIPWENEAPPALVERLLAALLAERSERLDTPRPPLMSAWQLRAAIDTRAWQAHVPARVRAAVDEARLHKELVDPAAPFTARDELALVTPAVLAANLPLIALRPVFAAAGRVLGLERAPAPAHSQPVPKGDFADAANDSDPEVTVSTG
ncbi:MAG: hypothetical protein ACRELB_02535 [Polyangiaceae bacterium]